jgi:adenine deaminase
MEQHHILSVARGEVPAELVLSGGRVVNVLSGAIEQADIAIADNRIAGVGEGYDGRQRIELGGAYVAPGLIDAHVHIESSLCSPAQFARAIVPRGVTTAVVDPHEIANVCGVAGVAYILEASRGLPLRVVAMAPSCVPATTLSSTGARLSAADLVELRGAHAGEIHGLAEVMNFPGVINGDPEVLAKLAAFQDRPIDGHCPGVSGKGLCAYAAAGIRSDHESVTVQEARDKLARGLYVLIRQASNARNLDALCDAVTPANSRRFCFCTDDRNPVDLLERGSIDMMVRRAIERGIDPIDAIRMATLNPAECYGLNDRGAIAPGRLADLFVFDDLRRPTASRVMCGGRWHDHAPAGAATPIPSVVRGRCVVDWSNLNLAVPARSTRIRVIGAIDGQLLTECRIRPMQPRDGHLHADPSRGILKMAVIERHGGTGRRGVGFIEGLGMQRGAIAGTVAHDHHNLVTIGADDESMLSAARAVAESGGGLSAAVGTNVLARLPLPIAGLMSDQPVEQVARAYARLLSAAGELGAAGDPFMTMSFMALEVIPALKLTDLGLVDVTQFEIVDLYAD